MATYWKTDHRCGNQGEEGHRVGCERWKLRKKFVQKYCGRFLYNNLHNRGIYTINQKSDKLYVDGLFYANKLEGYGQVIYSNGKFFEGLFRESKRFGPGVLTYPDGSQDVGLWNGFSLMRLSTLIGADFTPELGKTSQGQAFLLKYRTLVPIYEKSKDKAKEILQSLGARQEVIDNDSALLYNLNIRNPRSEFFNKNLFDANFFMEEEDCVIEIIESSEHPAKFEEEIKNQPEINKESEQQQEEEYSSRNSNITEDISDNNEESNLDKNCSCSALNYDYVTQLCVQLDEAGEILEKLLNSKSQIEEELSKRLPPNKRQPVSPILSQMHKSQRNFFNSETELSTTLYPNNNQLEDNYSGGDNGQLLMDIANSEQVSQAEVRLIDFEDETSIHSCELLTRPRYDDDEQVSTITLPFELNKEPTHIESNIKLPEDHIEAISNTGLMITENTLETQLDAAAKEIDSAKLKKILTDITFYRTIKSNLRRKIDRELSNQEEIVKMEQDNVSETARETEENIKKVRVTDLLAWNNEPIWIDMLQHCFRHRKSQYNVSFNVSDILTGQRQNFGDCGAYETSCRKFLMLCLEGHDRDAFALLKTCSINPDLCDARGNTGLMLAAIADRITVIDMLVNYGGKVDGMNDEGLTPLTMTLLRYIMFKLEISEWEKAFLREPKLRPKDVLGLKQWCPNKYLLRCKASVDYATIYSVKEAKERARSGSFHILEQTRRSATEVYFQSSSMMPSANYRTFNEIDEKLARIDVNGNNAMPNNFFKNPVQDYVFKTDFVRVPIKKPDKKKKGKKSKKDKKKKKGKDTSSKKSKKSSKKSTKSKKSSKKGTKAKYSLSINSTELKARQREQDEAEAREKLIAKKIEDIKKTLCRLLHVKANPNVGLVPMKPIFIVLFTNNSDILTMFLENGADPNTQNEEDATCLHVLASNQPSIKREALEMMQILLDFNANPNIKTNSKHWPEVNQEILDSAVSPSQSEEEIGKNPLHLLCLREDFALSDSEVFNGLAKILIENECDTDDLYLGHTPLSLAMFRGNLTLIDTLLGTKMINPYRVLGNDMGNALTMLLLRQFLHIWTNDVRLRIIDLLLKHLFNPLAPIGDGFDNAIHFMECEKEKHLAVATIKQPKKNKNKNKNKTAKQKKKAKGKKKKGKKETTIRLDEIEKYIVDETRKILVRHLQCQAVRYLYQFVMENIFWDPLIVALAKFLKVDEALNCIKLIFQFGLIELSSFSYVVVADLLEFVALHNDETFDRNKFEIKLQEMSILELKCPKLVYLPPPEIDDNYNIYKVCFQCLQANKRDLKKCPSCELVHFCSEKCNSQPNPYHKCVSNFYNNADESSSLSPNRLKLLIKLAEKSREERIQYFQLKELEMKMFEIKFKPVSLIRKVKQMRELVDELKKSRENFTRKNCLLEYSGDNILMGDSLVNIEPKPLSVADQVKINSTLSSFIDGLDNVSSASQKFQIKAPREKSQFLNSEIIQKKIKMIPKLDGHLSKLPLVYDSNARFGKVGKKSPVFYPVADVKKKIDEQAAKIVNKGYYMEMLSKVFADFNLPLILLPYACFKDGQIYYSMSDNVYFRKSFQKLNIPD